MDMPDLHPPDGSEEPSPWETQKALALSYLRRNWNETGWVPVLLVAAVSLVVAFAWLPLPVLWLTGVHVEDAAKRAELLNAVRSTMVTAVGGSAALFALYFSFGNLSVSVRQFRLAERQQLVDRLSKGVTALGEALNTQSVGGVCALRLLAEDASKLRDADSAAVWRAAMEALAAWVRKCRPSGSSSDGVDSLVQLALDAMGKTTRPQACDDFTFDLRATDLRGAFLRGAQWGPKTLVASDKRESVLVWVDFSGSDLCGVHIEDGCRLVGARFDGANLPHMTARRADMRYIRATHLASCAEAKLYGCDLRFARFGQAIQPRALTNCDVYGAQGIDLTGYVVEKGQFTTLLRDPPRAVVADDGDADREAV